MIIVPVKEGDNIERALKRFKRKFEKTGDSPRAPFAKAFRKTLRKQKKAKRKPSMYSVSALRKSSNRKLYYKNNP